MNQKSSSWIVIGAVGRAHGLRGHFFVSKRNEPIPASCKELFIGLNPDAESGQLFAISECNNRTNSGTVIRVEGVTDRNRMEKLRGLLVWARRSQMPLDEEEEFFWEDLIGKTVIDSEGQSLGIVDHVDNFGASDIMSIKDTEGRKLSVPIIPDYVDMDFSSETNQIQLVVLASFFAEVWND